MIKKFFKRQGIIALAITIAVALIIGSVVDFILKVNDDMKSDMTDQARMVVETYTWLYNSQAANLMNLTMVAAELMKSSEPITNEEIIYKLKKYAKTGNVVRALFITLDGHGYTDYGGYMGQSESDTSIDGIPLRDIKTAIYSSAFYSEELKKVIFGVVCPAVIGGVEGVLVSSYDVDDFLKISEGEQKEKYVDVGIIRSNGDVVISGSHSEYNAGFGYNIWESLRNKAVVFSENSPEQIRQDMKKNKTIFSTYSVRGVERYCAYMPMDVNDWYVAVTIPHSELLERSHPIKENGITLAVKLISIMTILFVIIISAGRREQKCVHDILQRAAHFDGMTGIFNRKAVEDAIISRIDSNDSAQTDALFIMDIDSFKGINDKYGHLVGDTVLKEFAQRLNEIFCEDNIIGRMGGDEFIALLTDCMNYNDIFAKANAITKDFKVKLEGEKETEPISVSVGISIYGSDGNSFIELYKCADKALYYAKDNGKNGFSFYADIFK